MIVYISSSARVNFFLQQIIFIFTKQPGVGCFHPLDYLYHLLVLDLGVAPGLDCLHHLDYLHQVLGLNFIT